MSEEMNQAPARESMPNRRALWAASLVAMIHFFTSGFIVYFLFRGSVFPNAVPAYIGLGASLAAITLSGIGVFLIQQGQYMRGLNLAYYALFLLPLVVTLFFTDRADFVGIFIAAISILMINIAFPRKRRMRAYIILGLFEISLAAIGITNPVVRQPIDAEALRQGQIFVVIFTLGMLAIFFFMVSRRTIRTRIIVSTIILVGAAVFFQTGVNLRTSREVFEAAEAEKLVSLYNDFNDEMITQAGTAAALSISYADREDIKLLYLAQDFDGLVALLTPVYDTLKREHNIHHMNIQNPDGTVYARIYDPSKRGGDVTYRETAAAALATQETVSGVDIGSSTIGVRSVSPLRHEGKFIGMLEIGLDHDQAFVDNLKERHGADYNLWLSYEAATGSGIAPEDNAPASPTSLVFFYTGTEPYEFPIEPEVYDQVLATGQPIIKHVTVEFQEMSVLVAPMLGYNERIIGVVEIISSRAEYLTTITQNRIAVLVPAVLLTTLSLIILVFITNQIVIGPVINLAAIAQKHIKGDLSARAENLPEDEIGQLGKTLNSLSEQLDETLRNQEEIISTRTREYEERSSYLEISAAVSAAIASITDPQLLMWQVVDLIKERFDLYYVGLFLVDSKNEWAILKAGSGKAGQAMLEREHKLRIGEGMIGWTIANAQARIALDVGEDAVRFDNPDLPETRSEGALPLRSRGRVLGAITIQSSHPEAFTPEIITTLQSMADQIAIALDNAELLARSDAALEAERRAYGELSRVGWMELVKESVVPRYISDAPNTARPVDETQDPVTPTEVPTDVYVQDDGFTATIPIKIRDVILGGIKLRKPNQRGVWTRDQLDLMKTLSEQVAIALESARLYNRAQRQAAREQAIGEITSKIGATTDVEAILRSTVEELGRQFDDTEIILELENDSQGKGVSSEL